MEDNGRKLLITGATGTLGQAFAHACEERALPFVLTTRAQLDICAPPSVAAAMAEHQPWAVINTAGFVRVAGCGSRARGAALPGMRRRRRIWRSLRGGGARW
jgi:dTDP-4-dehydrorhamnose reductase